MQYKEISRLIEDNKDDLIENTMQCIYGTRLLEIEGSERAQKSRRDLEYIINYLSESVYFNNQGLFEDFSIWLKSLFQNIGMDENVFIDTYKCLKQSLKNEVQGEERTYIIDVITDSMNNALQKEESIDSFIRGDNPYQDYAQEYLDLLLDNKKKEASQLITDKALSNMGVDEIYLNIFQPVQKEVGRLWHANKVSVAQEHYISSVTQLVMSQLYPHFLSMGGKKGSVVTTAVGNELHEIGIRMIADLLEVDGYDTIHLGANTPNESIVKTLMNNQTKLLGVSVTLPIHLSGLEKLITMIKNEKILKDLKIMVGGYAFNRNPELVNEFEIDEYSRDAKDAVKKANSLTEVVD